LDATHDATLSGGRCNQSNVAPQSEIAESLAHASTYLKERLDKYTGIGELSCAGCNAYEKCRSMGGFGMPKLVSLPCGISAVLMLTALAACQPRLDYPAAPTTNSYTEINASGLVSIRPYPNPDDVCEVIKTPEALADKIEDDAFLIACPKHERGAISDRIDDGALVIAHAKHWSILEVRQ
jgi:hypothetical protein